MNENFCTDFVTGLDVFKLQRHGSDDHATPTRQRLMPDKR